MSVTEGGTGPADDRPLTQQEYQQVQRLFSDPFSFPIQFKTWLVSYLETSDLNLPFSSVNGLIDLLGITGTGTGALGVLPAGLILPYGGISAPAGSLLCDGSAYLISNYPRLWDAIKSSGFGQPDASSFYTPDLRERIPVGRGARAEHATLGQSEGRPLGQRGTAHNTTSAGLRLAGDGSGNVSTGGGTSDGHPVLTDYGPNAHVSAVDIQPADGSKPNDTPAYLTLNFIIVA
jgi:microcystin-dependent protein